jgi:hypothetical protein
MSTTSFVNPDSGSNLTTATMADGNLSPTLTGYLFVSMFEKNLKLLPFLAAIKTLLAELNIIITLID